MHGFSWGGKNWSVAHRKTKWLQIIWNPLKWLSFPPLPTASSKRRIRPRHWHFQSWLSRKGVGEGSCVGVVPHKFHVCIYHLFNQLLPDRKGVGRTWVRLAPFIMSSIYFYLIGMLIFLHRQFTAPCRAESTHTKVRWPALGSWLLGTLVRQQIASYLDTFYRLPLWGC